jgi:hypothetical protein
MITVIIILLFLIYQLHSINPALFPSVNLSFNHEEKWVSGQPHAMLPNTH